MNDILHPLPDLRVNTDWARLPLFDRNKWRRVRFGDVVRVLKEQVDPTSGEVDRYVAGEHMDSEDVHIRRWGTIGDGYLGPAFIRRFRKSQVLYGSRRTYLKKVAVAEFDGVTANTTLVLEAVEEHLLQRLLPWLMLSEAFTQHSIRESKGSTNPYINWPDIAKFEFALPPLEQQPRMAELLWAADSLVQASAAAVAAAAVTKAAAMDDSTWKALNGLGSDRHLFRPLSEILTLCQYGLSCPLSETGQYPVLRMMNYDEELVVAEQLKYVDVTPAIAADYRVLPGDILFNRTNSADLVGKVGIFNLSGPYLFASYLVRLRTDPAIARPCYLNYYLNSIQGQARLRALATPGVSQSNISAGNLKKLTVPVPTLAVQDAVVSRLDQFAAAKRSCATLVSMNAKLLRTLVVALWG